VSAYLEAFVLNGIAAGGSALVLGAALPLSSSLRGESLAVQDESVRQGTYLAIERFTVVNTGQIAMSSFTVSTSPVPDSAPYCYAVYNVATGLRSAGSCPTTATNPNSVTIDSPLQPGGGADVVITIFGPVFEIGTTCTVTLTASDGGQQSVSVLVTEA